jgi:hypothetical protein
MVHSHPDFPHSEGVPFRLRHALFAGEETKTIDFILSEIRRSISIDGRRVNMYLLYTGKG